MAVKEMTVKAARRVATAATAEELNVAAEPQAEVPADIREQAYAWMGDYKSFLLERTENYVQRLAAAQASAMRGLAPEAGEPTVLNYPYWDLVTICPIQFIGAPPFRPHKVVANGEFAVIFAILFINPAPAPVGNPSATTALGARPFRIRFEQVNLTDVTNGPDFTITGVFPSPAPALSFFPFFFLAPDPGVNPRLVEVNVTADITTAAQPYAAFATNHLDIDSEPGFLFVPPHNPELEHGVPLRYMIYRK